jgi:hypothetical protein
MTNGAGAPRWSGRLIVWCIDLKPIRNRDGEEDSPVLLRRLRKSGTVPDGFRMAS